MRIPLPLRIGALIIIATLFYTYVGQMVPQKEVYPPEEVTLKADMTVDEMRQTGEKIMMGKGLCFTCHTVGSKGPLRFPDLQGIGTNAGKRIPGLNDLEYLAQSIYFPDKFIVPGFNPGMPVINKPPIGLTDQEILCVIAHLQSLGGVPTVTMQTKIVNGVPEKAGGDSAATKSDETTSTLQATGGQDSSPGEKLFQQFCAECHSLTPPSGTTTRAPNLSDVGLRLDAKAILASIINPDTSKPTGKEKKEALEKAGFYEQTKLKDTQAIVEFLMQRKGEK